jgi:1-acyl-sn-glycerol-3-phosphate acyltransferase
MLRPLVALIFKTLLGSNAQWRGVRPSSKQRIYFANHTSHLDTLVLWTALPPSLRKHTRPVAARDYWGKPGIRHWFSQHMFRAVLVDRERKDPNVDPMQDLYQALDQGHSLIIFPEGTRGTENTPSAFKSGLYHLARKYPDVELVPVYLRNLYRSMPKGSHIPVPLLCSVYFGDAITLQANEDKTDFLNRARQAVADLV